mgnify:FL=1
MRTGKVYGVFSPKSIYFKELYKEFAFCDNCLGILC